MSHLQISDRRSIENLMRTSGQARWVRRLEIRVSGGDPTGNSVSADLERPSAAETAPTAARTATADEGGPDVAKPPART